MGGAKQKNRDSVPPPPPPPPPPPYPGHTGGWNDSKNNSYPAYGFTNLHNTQYGASAAHVSVPFPPEVKPDVFNVWGITGYTGSIDTSRSPNPEQTACHLAKIQQAMTGHNQFDPFKFPQRPIDLDDAKVEDMVADSNDAPSDEIPVPPKPAEMISSYPGYYPVYPGYGFHFGTAPPPCPPKTPKKKEDKKCKHCAGASGQPIKRINRANSDVLCWACVWRAYGHVAQEIWEESEDVDMDDE